MLTIDVTIKLLITVLLPAAGTALLMLAERKTSFGKRSYWFRQGIIGLLFGLLSIAATEFGVRVAGATLNVRDAAPVCAGLIFGAPAGILAGLIGGVERWFAALWGAGEYTRLACTAATIMAGLFSAFLRKFIFENRKPLWFYGMATGSIVEVYHMLMVFLTHIDDAFGVYDVVSKCALPMIALNGVSVMLAMLTASLISGEKLYGKRTQKRISQLFQRGLLICVIFAFGVTCFLTISVQNGISEKETAALLRLNLKDVRTAVLDASDENLLAVTRKVAAAMNTLGSFKRENLGAIMEVYDVAEINIVDENGVIAASTNEDYLGFDMSLGSQSAAFMVLLDGQTKELVQEYRVIDYGERIMRKYAGVAIEDGFVQVAFDTERFQRDIADEVRKAARHRHIGETGSILICDESFRVVSSAFVEEGAPMTDTGLDLSGGKYEAGTVFRADVYGEPCLCMHYPSEGFYIVALYPEAEAQLTRNLSVYFTVFTNVLIFTALFVSITFLINLVVVENIRRVNRSLKKITEGELEETVSVRSSVEFASLSDGINATVDTLKRYIAEAAARIDQELGFAKAIQHSALPNVFPPYPNKTELFDVWAYMKTAKEVGGDFYDFYLPGEDRLAFLIADVSGKGIPAALFMMTAKTMLKNMTEAGADVQDVFTRANEQLCESNEAGMFVTAWMGILDLRTGLLTFANAGHNPPLIRHGDGSFEYLRTRAGFVLAGMEGVRYRKNELQLEPGDTIFLYTDGVTEAADVSNSLYGEERLLNRLNTLGNSDMEGLCRAVKADVDEFAGEAPQFDDITMLGLRFRRRMESSDRP